MSYSIHEKREGETGLAPHPARCRVALTFSCRWCLTPYEMQREEQVRAMSERYVAAMQDHSTIEIIEAGRMVTP